MRGRSGFALAFAFVLLVAVAMPSTALAFVQRSGEAVTVSENIDDDLYVFGSAVNITGNVTGDVVAFGQSVTVSGEVSGGVIAAGQSVRIQGPVGGTVRAAGQNVEIAGAVGGDALLAGATVNVAPGGGIARDLLVGASAVSLGADVGRNVLAGAETLSIASAVGGMVTADATDLTVTDAGSIGGDLTYYSDKEARVSGEVGGTTVRHPARTEKPRKERPAPSPVASFGWVVLGWIQSLIGMALFGVLAVVALRRFATVAADEVVARPLPSIGIGFGVLALVFPVAGFVFFLGLLVGGWWIACVLTAIVWLLALVGMVIGALASGRWALARMGQESVHPILATLFGVAVIWVIGAIPFIGWLAGFTAMLFGMGAIVLMAYGTPKATAAAEPVAAPPASPGPPAVGSL